MSELPDFKSLFGTDPGIAYSQKVVEEIRSNRHELDGILFLDRLLGTMDLQQSVSSYPPRSHSDLRKLYDQIAASSTPPHHKQSVLYYILLDLSLPKRSAATFARDNFLPPKYATLIDGLWALDRLEFPRALDALTDPSLIPTFAEETLMVLCKHASSDAQGCELALGYYEAVAPDIRSQHILDEVFKIMCRSNVSEAFAYARSQGDAAHRRYFQSLLEHVLNEKPGRARADAAEEFIGLPFNKEEEGWFTDFLTRGHGRTLDGAKDMLIMRQLLTGDFDKARELSGSFDGQRINSLTWSRLMKMPS